LRASPRAHESISKVTVGLDMVGVAKLRGGCCTCRARKIKVCQLIRWGTSSELHWLLHEAYFLLGLLSGCADVSLSVRWQNTLRTVFGEEKGMFNKFRCQVSQGAHVYATYFYSKREASSLHKAAENPVEDVCSTVKGCLGSIRGFVWHATSWAYPLALWQLFVRQMSLIH
jgi:hypothetical protein